MNKQQRKRIDDIVATLEALCDEETLKADAEAAMATVQDSATELSEIADEEQEKFDNMPEGLQQGDRGQEMEAAAGALQSAADMLEAIDFSNKEEGWEEEIAGEIQDVIAEVQSF